MESQNCELFVAGERKGGHNNFIEEKESVKIQEFIRERVYNNFLLRERGYIKFIEKQCIKKLLKRESLKSNLKERIDGGLK